MCSTQVMITNTLKNLYRKMRSIILFRSIPKQIIFSEIKHEDKKITIKGWIHWPGYNEIRLSVNNKFIKNISIDVYRPDVFQKKLAKTPYCGFNTLIDVTSNENDITISVVKNNKTLASITKVFNIENNKKKSIDMNKGANLHIPNDKRKNESIWLDNYKANKYTSHGEDGIIGKIFEIVNLKNKFCVEFGAGDGIDLSNTRKLLDEGWSGILIEPGEAYIALEKNNSNNNKVETINSFIHIEGDKTVDNILGTSKLKPPHDIDFMSIDIDGCDIHVFNTLNVYKPRLICIEFNQFIGNDVYYIQEANFEINHGSSLLAMIDIFKSKEYELVATAGANAFFVKSELFELFNIKYNDIDSMYFPKLETKLLHMPNGDLILSGMTKHPWKGFDIDQEAIQVLPKNMRKWKFNGNIWPINKL